jgi:hypothetical protein
MLVTTMLSTIGSEITAVAALAAEAMADATTVRPITEVKVAFSSLTKTRDPMIAKMVIGRIRLENDARTQVIFYSDYRTNMQGK